jgi:hypothetical protein
MPIIKAHGAVNLTRFWLWHLIWWSRHSSRWIRLIVTASGKERDRVTDQITSAKSPRIAVLNCIITFQQYLKSVPGYWFFFAAIKWTLSPAEMHSWTGKTTEVRIVTLTVTSNNDLTGRRPLCVGEERRESSKNTRAWSQRRFFWYLLIIRDRRQWMAWSKKFSLPLNRSVFHFLSHPRCILTVWSHGVSTWRTQGEGKHHSTCTISTPFFVSVIVNNFCEPEFL